MISLLYCLWLLGILNTYLFCNSMYFSPLINIDWLIDWECTTAKLECIEIQNHKNKWSIWLKPRGWYLWNFRLDIIDKGNIWHQNFHKNAHKISKTYFSLSIDATSNIVKFWSNLKEYSSWTSWSITSPEKISCVLR